VAKAIGEAKIFGHLSSRVATLLEFFNRPNMISMRLWYLA